VRVGLGAQSAMITSGLKDRRRLWILSHQLVGRHGDDAEGYLRNLLELVYLIHPMSRAFSFAIVQALPMNSAWLNGERRSTCIGYSLQ
jgi:hypothetical protein